MITKAPILYPEKITFLRLLNCNLITMRCQIFAIIELPIKDAVEWT
jgi:hypothetical protein